MNCKIVAFFTFTLINLNIGWAQFPIDKQEPNIKQQPVWGPIGYNYVSSYYLPEHNIYYIISTQQYAIKEGNQWKLYNALPSKFAKVDLYSTYKYVIQDGNIIPYVKHTKIKNEAKSIKGSQQVPILDAVKFDDRYK